MLLTVTKLTVVGAGGAEYAATLTCNDSVLSLGTGVTSGYGLDQYNQGGTFTGGTGAHTIGSILCSSRRTNKLHLSSG